VIDQGTDLGDGGQWWIPLQPQKSQGKKLIGFPKSEYQNMFPLTSKFSTP